MARCPFATWDPIRGWPTAWFRTLPGKGRAPDRVCHHKTVGRNYPRSTYAKGGGIPHFTVGRDGTRAVEPTLWQHYDTEQSSRALRNLAGGVETNRQRIVQIEAIGIPGETMRPDELRLLRRLLDWLEDVHGIDADVWPGGRPPQGVGQLRHVSRQTWVSEGGQYGHSQVPENDHWDPAYTDAEWAVVYRPGQARPPIVDIPIRPQEYGPMDLPLIVHDTSAGTFWLVTEHARAQTSANGYRQYVSGTFSDGSKATPLQTVRLTTEQFDALYP